MGVYQAEGHKCLWCRERNVTILLVTVKRREIELCVFGSLTGEEVEVDVDEVLVPPRDAHSVLLVVAHHLVRPVQLPHPGQLHQHHARIHTWRQNRES